MRYAAYVLNRSPTRIDPQRQSPIEMLEGHAPSLMQIITFGSPCMVFRDASTCALQRRATRGLILGRSEETKGLVVYLLQDQKVIATQHVKSIETLSQAQNASLLLAAGVNDGSTDGISNAALAQRNDTAGNDTVGGGNEANVGGAAVSAQNQQIISSTRDQRRLNPPEPPTRVQTRSASDRRGD